MEIKNEIEFQIVAKMIGFPLLAEEIEDSWRFKINREFDMTNDSHLFETTPKTESLVLYEGKMIWQYEIGYAKPKYWIDESKGRRSILGKRDDNQELLDYQHYRLGFRDIAASTNERSVIATITPKVFHGNKIPQSIIFDQGQKIITNIDLLYLVAFFNSYPFDFHIRNRITTTLNFHFVYNTPCPRLKPEDTWYLPIIERSARLICTSDEYAELWEEVMKTKWSINVAANNDSERNQIKAELDGIIAHIYGLTEDEFVYVLATFPIVSKAQKQISLDYFNEITHLFENNVKISNIESLASTSLNQTMKEFSLDEGIYSIRDVVQISQMSIDKVTRWFKDLSNAQYEGLSGNQRSDINNLKVSFHGLIELVVIDELRKNKFSLKQILQARTDLKEKTGKLYPFATNNVKDNLKIVGKSLVFRFDLGDVTLNGTGQYNLSIIEEFFKNIEFDSEGLALRLFPLKNSKLISVDPRSGGGKAVITDKGVWAEAIASAFNGMESIPMLEDQYDLTKQEILAAVEFWN